jgi:hypothetical protein
MRGKRVVADVIEIGRLLLECKERWGHGNWLPWLEAEFGWGVDTAEDYINIHKTFGNSDRGPNLVLPIRSLRLLAAPGTPESARAEVIERAEAGEHLKHDEVREIIASHGREAVLAAATHIRAAELQARDDARKAVFTKTVTVSLAAGLHHGDFRVLSGGIEDGCTDLVLTDPPYDEPSLYGDAARVAARILKPGGSFLAYAAHRHLPTVLSACAAHLDYWWTLAALQPGATRLMEHLGIRCTYTPIVWFVRGTRGDVQSIIFDSASGPREKTLHPWQKSEAVPRYYIENLTAPNGLVVDFFAGSGTTCAAAKALGRRWIGFEIDADTVERASQRIGAAPEPGLPLASDPAPPPAAEPVREAEPPDPWADLDIPPPFRRPRTAKAAP